MLMPSHRCSSCHRQVTGRCPHCVRTRQAHYDTTRLSAAARGYCSKRWRALRAQKLSRDPLCSVCLAAGRTVIATDVDHLERHDGTNDPRFWDWANLDSKCHACHSQKTAREDSTFARRT
jgi:5-methylcytosine-specific restriction endonuclease McrA